MEETRKDEIELSLRKKYHKTIFSRFARAINHYQLVENGDHVAVFMEQGRNELILAKCFQEIKRHRKIDFEVDFFGLCREDDGKIVSIAEETGIPVRKIRSYGEIKEAGCNKVAVADCYEDVIETVLAGVLYKGEISTLMPKEKGCGDRLELIRPFYLVPEMTEIFLDQQKEIKHLLEEFGSINPGIAANIFKSVENVNLNTVIAYRTDTELHSFLKDYK